LPDPAGDGEAVIGEQSVQRADPDMVGGGQAGTVRPGAARGTVGVTPAVVRARGVV